MRLHELCEPLFQCVCQLNRIGRLSRGGKITQSYGPERTRGRIEAILDDMKAKAATDPRLGDQYAKIELTLLFFVDFMIRESGLDFAKDWQEMAAERDEFAGDEKFFDLLEETLADPGEAATERLSVFYSCLGLGFTGIYTGQPEVLRRLMGQIFVRIRQWLRAEETPRICPEAYETIDERDLITPPGRKLLGMVLVLVALTIILLFANIFAYDWAQRDLHRSIDTINSQVRPAPGGQATAAASTLGGGQTNNGR